MFRDDLIAYGEPESCAALFGGEERVEDLSQMVLGDPAPGIGNLQKDLTFGISSVTGKCGGDRKDSAFPHRLNAVEDHVPKSLLQLRAITPNRDRQGVI